MLIRYNFKRHHDRHKYHFTREITLGLSKVLFYSNNKKCHNDPDSCERINRSLSLNKSYKVINIMLVVWCVFVSRGNKQAAQIYPQEQTELLSFAVHFNVSSINDFNEIHYSNFNPRNIKINFTNALMCCQILKSPAWIFLVLCTYTWIKCFKQKPLSATTFLVSNRLE